MDTTPARIRRPPLLPRRLVLAASIGSAAGLRGAVAQVTAPSSGEIRLGALYPLSGSLSLLGDESFRGVEIAVEERNAAGGLLSRPGAAAQGRRHRPEPGGGEARRLLGAERAAGLFGTFSSALSFAATQVAEMQRVPYFELGAIGDPITERGFRTLFRTCPRATDFAREAVNAVPRCWRRPGAFARGRQGSRSCTRTGCTGRAFPARRRRCSARAACSLVEKLGYAARGAELAAAVQR
jgi:branched-chain amino acid transport system substrate-binding protein